MYQVRIAKKDDLQDLLRLSQFSNLLNLPRDPKVLAKKIQISLESCKNPTFPIENSLYILVLEHCHLKKIIGVSLIHGKHGTPEDPHFYLSVGKEKKYSSTINMGFTHGTLKLGFEYDGYSEIGGLILDPEYRGAKEKLGKFISYARFMFIGLNLQRFTDIIHTELLPPFDQNGNSPLWEAIGRRFMNMDYHEADLLSRTNKEFILSLYPSENIYQTLLSIEARSAIGKVGEQTLPVKKMLESIGFEYTHEVDPFDGGPHFRCPTKKIKPIKDLKSYQLVYSEKIDRPKRFLISNKTDAINFCCWQISGSKQEQKLLTENREFIDLEQVYGFPLDY